MHIHTTVLVELGREDGRGFAVASLAAVMAAAAAATEGSVLLPLSLIVNFLRNDVFICPYSDPWLQPLPTTVAQRSLAG